MLAAAVGGPLCWEDHVSDEQSGKGKVLPRTAHESPEEDYKYSSTLSLTSALDGVGG